MVSLCNMQHYVIYNYIFRPCKWAIIRLFVEPLSWLYNRSLGGGEISSLTNSYSIVNLLVLRTTWWWSTYKDETCSCILRSVAYYIVIPSDNLLCFCLHVYVNIHIIIYIVLSHLILGLFLSEQCCKYQCWGKKFKTCFVLLVSFLE